MEPACCALLSGVLCEDAVPGVVLVEDCDCDPHFEEDAELSGEVLEGVEVALEELLDCGAALESGVEVLLLEEVLD